MKTKVPAIKTKTANTMNENIHDVAFINVSEKAIATIIAGRILFFLYFIVI